MKKWFNKNKKILIIGLLSLGIMYIGIYWFLSIAERNQELVLIYFETGTVDSKLMKLVYPIIMVLVSGIVFIANSLILLITTLFPKSNAFNVLTMKSDRDFIKDLPRRIRKEVMRNE